MQFHISRAAKAYIVDEVSKPSSNILSQFAFGAAPRKYQLDLEIAKKSNFSKLAQNEALRALDTKILF